MSPSVLRCRILAPYVPLRTKCSESVPTADRSVGNRFVPLTKLLKCPISDISSSGEAFARYVRICCIRRSLKNAGTWRGLSEPSVRCAFHGARAYRRIQHILTYRTKASPDELFQFYFMNFPTTPVSPLYMPGKIPFVSSAL